MLGLAIGAAACLASGYFWSIWFPLNKKMWTSSYVLVAAGWSLLLFALVYWAVEQRGWGKSGWSKRLLWPWLVFGSNAIVAYIDQRTAGARHRPRSLHLRRDTGTTRSAICTTMSSCPSAIPAGEHWLTLSSTQRSVSFRCGCFTAGRSS